MSELTGPVLGITLVLTSVFLPASFLPGITGQMFRQFALVIASTAIISALNALTLKPTQCALYLRPIDKNKQINWFYRGFNRVYDAVELRYIGVVSWMAQRPRQMVCVFFAIVGSAGVIFAFHPSAFLPLEDQGYCLVIARLPAGASQPRVREVAANIDSDAERHARHQRMGHQRRLSRISDSANLSNVITEYVMYEDLDKRPAALSQDAIVADLQKQVAIDPEGHLLGPDSAADTGTGSSRRLSDDGRGSRQRRPR